MNLEALRKRLEDEVIFPAMEITLRTITVNRAAELFPGWTVGWWAFVGGRCCLEVTRRWKVDGQRLPKCARRTFAGAG